MLASQNYDMHNISHWDRSTLQVEPTQSSCTLI